MRWIWRYFLAWFRLSERAVCDLSQSRGLSDFHDSTDDDFGPVHSMVLRCRRCKKEFRA